MIALYLSAAHKSSGKTTLSIGLIREFKRLGYQVQPFKKGPDYIDPMWLSTAAERTCYNLDFHTMSMSEIQTEFRRRSQQTAVHVIEGNVGLFDSIHLDGAHSNAELAKLLAVPVILIVDAQGMGRGIAPLLHGYQAFDPELQIAGVLLNKIGGERHGANLRRVIEYYTDLPVLGMIPRHPDLEISERHLGLIPSNELDTRLVKTELIRRHIADHVDIDALLACVDNPSTNSFSFPFPDDQTDVDPAAQPIQLRLGLAQDQAFGFYYPDDLAALERLGVQLVPFSPIADAELPVVDALFLGGGFPEFYMDELSRNVSMRAAIADFILDGGATYAECGGLMYLCQQLHWHDQSRAMCGVLAADVAMYDRPRGRGYVRLRETSCFPWPTLSQEPVEIPAHEFHHSAIIEPAAQWQYAYDVLRGYGVDGQHDGIVMQRLLASYAHLRNVAGQQWTQRFVNYILAA
jgi:cobyrinic acid a,c-diamide synthase